LAGKSESGTDAGPTSLVIFIRLPRPGEVKSRLAQTLGPKRAAVFYRLCVERTARELDRVPGEVRRYLSFSDAGDKDAVRHWMGPRFRFIAQTEGDLGTRLEHGFQRLLRRVPGRAIIMASDVPDLSTGIMIDALNALDSHDLVIGPCHDGGYYLIGMKELHSALFQGISWSTDRVLGQTLTKAGERGLSVSRLATLRDIDTADDLRRWADDLAAVSSPILQYARTVLLESGPREGAIGSAGRDS
jgi:rSAM/selenodomain-associated transferase 1